MPTWPRGGSVLLEESRIAEKHRESGVRVSAWGAERAFLHAEQECADPRILHCHLGAAPGKFPVPRHPPAPAALKGWIKYSAKFFLKSRGKYSMHCTAAAVSHFQSRLVDLQGNEDEDTITITAGKCGTPKNIYAAFIWLEY